MRNRSFASSLTSNLGLYAYAVGGIVLGLIGFAWGDFATTWQRVMPGVPGRTALAYVTALLELAGGLALLWPRTARAGAALLTVIFSVFTLLWIPKALSAPQIYDSWGNVFEELSGVIGGLVLCAALAPRDSALARREGLIGRSYGICVISFGVVHVVSFAGLPAWIPAWIPPGPVFWAAATTVCFFAAAAAILSGILSAPASRWLIAMIMGFELLIWLPKLIATPHDHFIWAGNGISIALTGACWAVSDSIVAESKRKAAVKDAHLAVGSAA